MFNAAVSKIHGLTAICGLLQMPAATGQSGGCSLDGSWAVHGQVTDVLANGKRELICSQGPNWLMGQSHAYYFEAAFLAPAWQAC